MTPTAEGLLFSQIGYNLGEPCRAVFRSPESQRIPAGSSYRISQDGKEISQGTWHYWGQRWNHHWWIAEMDCPQAGTFQLLSDLDGLHEPAIFRVGDDLLWQETAPWVGLHQFEKRAMILVKPGGWQDCGVPWREFTSHAAAITSLAEVLEDRAGDLDPDEQRRYREQIALGCDYLAACQDQARELGFPEGSATHEIDIFPAVYPTDLSKGALALAHGALALRESNPAHSQSFHERALAMLRAFEASDDYSPLGFWPAAHGAPVGAHPPRERMTRDLLICAQTWLLLDRLGAPKAQNHAIRLVGNVLDRQVSRQQAEDGLYGHFRTFDSEPWTEAAWIHQEYGSWDHPDKSFHDNGGVHPHFLFPIIELIQCCPDHPHRKQWQDCLETFAEGYFLPACARNPFGILPNRVLRDGPLVEFSGAWHGTNIIYGYAARLATKLGHLLDDPRLRPIATANRQWIAGLNAGLTASSFDKAIKTMGSSEVPPGKAVPVSMIHGIGDRYAGSWTNIKGSICNGFCAIGQFRTPESFDPTEDGPNYLSDEDWIPHGAAWLAGLA